MVNITSEQKTRASDWFKKLRDLICSECETIESELTGTKSDLDPGRFQQTSWNRPGGGGGVMSLMHGRVFEKVGVNFSEVEGELSEKFSHEIKGAFEDRHFWACGVSFVAHLCSPLVPAAHMNTRHIATTASWFGGGSDLTPIYPNDTDTKLFHDSLRTACEKYDKNYYPRFKNWCDEYFYLPHRSEPRGVGGIFYDDLRSENWETDFSFNRDIGLSFLKTYPSIIRKHMNKPWTEEQRKYQLIKRGRYVEFNLLYDRGTKFGLQTNGNTDAILMSLPPEVHWP